MVNHLAHSCCDTEDLRGLAHWNLPSYGFGGIRSGSYKSEVTNEEACTILSRTQIRQHWEQDMPELLDKFCSILNSI